MSKNAFWMAMIFVAAIVGVLLGPILFKGMSLDSLLLFTAITFGLIIAYCVWAISKNKNALPADPAAQANAKAMAPASGMGRIYVTRRGFVAALQGMDIEIANIGKSQIKSGQMLMAEVAPGSYKLSCQTANAKLSKPSEMDVTVAAGDNVVIDAMFEMGALKGSIKLTQLSAGKAQDNVAATKLMRWADAG